MFFNGVSGGTRTHYPQFRKLLLYPDELRRQQQKIITSGTKKQAIFNLIGLIKLI